MGVGGIEMHAEKQGLIYSVVSGNNLEQSMSRSSRIEREEAGLGLINFI